MRRMLTTGSLASVLMLCSACALFSRPVKIDGRPVVELGSTVAQLPKDLDRDCDDPSVLPNKAVGAGETERDWGHDRKALVDCKGLHKKTREFYKDRDSKLALTANGKQ